MMEINIFSKHFHYELLLFTFIILSTKINFSLSDGCVKNAAITDTTCFNDVLKFDSKKYRAGHFVTYKNGDMIAEFSDDGGDSDGFARIFYGLKKDGRYYFPNNSPTYEITNIGNIGSARGRYESLNQLVVTQNDLNRENEFLFSTSSYESLTELHIMENRTYTYARSKNFMGKNIFSFQYSLVEAKYSGSIFYFIGFTYSNDDENGNLLDIKKFGLTSFSLSDYNNIHTKTIDYHLDNRIVILFVLQDLNGLVLMYIKNDKKLYFKYMDFDLNSRGETWIADLTLETEGENARDRDGIFFKSVKLTGNKRAFSFYVNGNGQYLYFRIYEFSKNNEGIFSATQILSTSTHGNYWFSSKVTYNDIYKIKDNRIAVATVSNII